MEEYKDDLIVLSGNLMGEISNKILNIGQKSAEEALLWWKKIFKDDFYIEIMRHNQEDEDLVNNVLVEFSKKHNSNGFVLSAVSYTHLTLPTKA